MKAGNGRDNSVQASAETGALHEIGRTPDGPMCSVHSPCLWAVDDDLRTVGASLAFAQLVGFGQLLLVGLPWYVILPIGSRQTVEELIETTELGATASFELRHLDGQHIPVAGHLVHGGQGWHDVVLCVTPLAARHPSRPVPDLQEGAGQ